jgi:hypothetical protein
MSLPPKKRTSWKRITGSPGVVRYCLFNTTIANVFKEGKQWIVVSDLITIDATFATQDDAKKAVELSYDTFCSGITTSLQSVDGEGIEEAPDMLTSLIEDVPEVEDDE